MIQRLVLDCESFRLGESHSQTAKPLNAARNEIKRKADADIAAIQTFFYLKSNFLNEDAVSTLPNYKPHPVKSN